MCVWCVFVCVCERTDRERHGDAVIDETVAILANAKCTYPWREQMPQHTHSHTHTLLPYLITPLARTVWCYSHIRYVFINMHKRSGIYTCERRRTAKTSDLSAGLQWKGTTRLRLPRVLERRINTDFLLRKNNPHNPFILFLLLLFNNNSKALKSFFFCHCLAPWKGVETGLLTSSMFILVAHTPTTGNNGVL